jgi:hypothetical protein
MGLSSLFGMLIRVSKMLGCGDGSGMDIKVSLCVYCRRVIVLL